MAFTQGLEYDQLCTLPTNCTDVLWESTGKPLASACSTEQIWEATHSVMSSVKQNYQTRAFVLAGMNGESEMRLVELTTGRVLKKKKLANEDFGEGMVKSGNR